MLLLIDNYDSFTYNLYQYLAILGQKVEVKLNDKFTIAELEIAPPEAIIISPGPGRPEDAGMTLEILTHFTGKIPILGVCLGHQAIAQSLGGQIVPAKQLMHGKTSSVTHDNDTIFTGINSPFIVTRYHSLVVKKETLPCELIITAESEDGEIMALRHKHLPIEGVQFHPEAILSEDGVKLLNNFLQTYVIIHEP